VYVAVNSQTAELAQKSKPENFAMFEILRCVIDESGSGLDKFLHDEIS